MKALVYTGVAALELRDMPDPVAGPGEALVRIKSSGICGSDMHAFLGHDERRPAPLVLGHEAAGLLDDGRRVTINPLVSCGTCRDCKSGRTNICAKRQIISLPPRQGAFAQAVVMPQGNLVTVPDGVSMDHAALAEPLACGWHAVRLSVTALGGNLAPMRCVVIGGGAIGVGAALALRAQGAVDVTVVEPNALRREFLAGVEGFGVLEAAPETGADLVIDAVGYAATRATACALVRPGGVIAHIGLGEGTGGLDVRRMTLQEITFIGTYTYTAQDFRDTAAAIFDGRFGALNWIEKRPLADGLQAFQDIRAGRVAAPKIILVP
jgi:L-iditol 2-dehydrogenase